VGQTTNPSCTSRVITTNSGVVCYDADFYPYGGERSYTNTCPQNYKFEGKERDTETGNDDFGARYYSNRFGRWLSADWSSVPVPVAYANLTNPQTLNLYAMVADDPESFADLDGHCGDGTAAACTVVVTTEPANQAARAQAAANEKDAPPQVETRTYTTTQIHDWGYVTTTTTTYTYTTTFNADGTPNVRTDVQGTTTTTHADGNGNFTTTQRTWGIKDLTGAQIDGPASQKQLTYGEAVKAHGATAMSMAQDDARPSVMMRFIARMFHEAHNPSARTIERAAGGAIMATCLVAEPCGAVEAGLSLVVGGAAVKDSLDHP